MNAIHAMMMVILLALALAAPAAGRQEEPAAGADIEVIFAHGQAAFDEGLTQRQADQYAARRSFERAASIWQSIVDEHGIHNGRLLYNIGNAHVLAEELGPAILAYRQAEQYIAGDQHLVASLEQARRRVMTHIEPQTGTRVREALLFWHEGWSTYTRLLLFTVLSGIAWLWALARLNARLAFWPRWPGWAAGVAAIALLASLVAEHLEAGKHVEGVVMRDVTGRKGPSEIGYEPSFTEPLAEGVEFTIAEDRNDWLLARLPDGRETWLPRQAVALLN